MAAEESSAVEVELFAIEAGSTITEELSLAVEPELFQGENTFILENYKSVIHYKIVILVVI